jgi:hypothetical protein
MDVILISLNQFCAACASNEIRDIKIAGVFGKIFASFYSIAIVKSLTTPGDICFPSN